jgi:hypothetical protein
MEHEHDTAHWEQRAAEARAVAAELTDPEARDAMLEIAKGYDRIAELVRAKAKSKPR